MDRESDEPTIPHNATRCFASGDRGGPRDFLRVRPGRRYQQARFAVAIRVRRVQFAPGPLQRQLDQNRELLLNLSEDSLLRPYRLREGLPAPGQDLGGWYDTDAFAPGFTYGQWMSALARYYASTGDPGLPRKSEPHDPRLRGHHPSRGQVLYRKPLSRRTSTTNWYAASSTHIHTSKDPLALHALSRATDAVWKYLPPKAMPHWEAPVDNREDFTLHAWDESYTLPENQFLAYQRSGDARHLELAKRLLFNAEFFDPLAKGENVCRENTPTVTSTR